MELQSQVPHLWHAPEPEPARASCPGVSRLPQHTRAPLPAIPECREGAVRHPHCLFRARSARSDRVKLDPHSAKTWNLTVIPFS